MNRQVSVNGRDVTLRDAIFKSPQGAITLSIAGRDDVDALTFLECRTFDSARYDQMSLESMLHMTRRGNGVMILARKGALLMGYALLLFRKNSTKARFGSLAVDPDAQGQGIGTILFAAAETAAKAAGAAIMLLEIRADNKRLEASYLKKGYTVDRREARYYPDGCACLKLSRHLTRRTKTTSQDQAP